MMIQVNNFKEFIESIPELPGVYIFPIKDGYHKFGHTGNLRKRLNSHYYEFDYKCIIKYHICHHKVIAEEIESDIKTLLKEDNYLTHYPKKAAINTFHTEIFKTDDNIIIDKVINAIDTYLTINHNRVEKYKQLYEFEKSINDEYPCIPLMPTIIKPINKMLQKQKKSGVVIIEPTKYEAIVNTHDITEEEFHDLSRTSILTQEQELMINKYCLCKHYNWAGEIDIEFMKNYANKKVQRQYINLSDILRSNNLRISLRDMEISACNKVSDINLSKHKITVDILQSIGFDSILDQREIHCSRFLDNKVIKESIRIPIEQNMKYIHKLFNKKEIIVEWSKRNFLAFINGIFESLYGFKVQASNNACTYFKIIHKVYNNLFSSTPNMNKPYILINHISADSYDKLVDVSNVDNIIGLPMAIK